MTLANTQVRTLAAQRFEIMGVVGLLAVPTVLPPVIFLAILILQHHTA